MRDFPFIRCLLLSLDSPAAFSLLNSIVVDTSLSSYYRLSHLGKEYERNAVSLSDGSKEPPEASEIGKYIASCISHLGPRRPIFSIPHAGGRLSNEWDDRLNNFSIRLLPGVRDWILYWHTGFDGPISLSADSLPALGSGRVISLSCA